MNPKTETSYGTPTHRISFVYPTCRALNKQLRVFSHFGHDLRGGAYTGTAPWPLAGKKWGQRIWSQERFLHPRLSLSCLLSPMASLLQRPRLRRMLIFDKYSSIESTSSTRASALWWASSGPRDGA